MLKYRLSESELKLYKIANVHLSLKWYLWERCKQSVNCIGIICWRPCVHGLGHMDLLHVYTFDEISKYV